MKRTLNEPHVSPGTSHVPDSYTIRVRGHLDARWSDWLAGMDITLEEDGNTLLSGPVVDQAALHGILRKVRDLGMPLLLVICNANSVIMDEREQQDERN